MEKKELPDVIYVNKENGQLVPENYPNSEAYTKLSRTVECRYGEHESLVVALNAGNSVREIIRELDRWRAVVQNLVEDERENGSLSKCWRTTRMSACRWGRPSRSWPPLWKV